MSNRPCGLVVLHKPPGVTSFRSLTAVKQSFGTRRVGHTGTLDKFASGVLPALVGSASRFSSFFMDLPKTYIATIRFGRTTTTLDPEGEPAGTGPLPRPEDAQRIAKSFIGELQQLPPDFSALHVNGRRASDIARTGEKPALKARAVHIHDMQVLSSTENELRIKVDCSRGTYIRALARDIADQLGTVAYLTALERSAVGSFTIDGSVDPEDINVREHLQPIEDFLHQLPAITIRTVPTSMIDAVMGGVPLRPEMFVQPPSQLQPEISALKSETGEFLALSEFDGTAFRYRFVRDRDNT
ncbi:MAG: tRNA pseudouridine(55) synthase TruB [Spirochaetaceae bacterium]|nr:MAG: tRNA pseudouridine(55) synthase TruB [Spirochaetaceae bacterium]